MPGYDFRQSAYAGRIEHKSGESEPKETGADEPIGTEKAGYATPDQGPFECGNCEHYAQSVNATHGNCDHPDVIEDLGSPARVAKKGCCNYFRPEGKT